MSVPTIGILGGIGSGKSSVIRHVTNFDLQVIDADKIGHDLLEDADVLQQLTQTFPVSIFDSSGEVIRLQLAQLVFGKDAEHKAALKQLEQIIHPAIHREITAQIQNASTDAVILDAAILVETGWADECDLLIYIDTPESQRIERVSTNRNWTAEELKHRESTQLPLTTKKQLADFIVDNSGTIEDASRQLTDILTTLIKH